MINQFKSDLIKVLNNKLFWIFIAIYLIGFWATTDFVQFFFQSIQKQAQMKFARFEFPMVWEYISYISKFLNFIPVLIVVYFISNEYNFKTLRQSIINGSSVKDIILSNQLMAVSLTFICLLTTSIFTLIIGNNNTENVNDIFNGSKYLLNYFILTLGMFNMVIFFNHLFRGLLVTILVFGGYFLFAENILISITIFYGWTETWIGSIVEYLPVNSIFGLLMIEDNLQFKEIQPSLIPGILWTIFFPVASYFVVKRRDL